MNRAFWIGLCLTVSAVANEQDRAAILKDVKAIAAPGVPGTVCAFGEKAFVIADAPDGRGTRSPLIAATRFGKGKAILFGHDGYFSAESLKQQDTARLFTNLITWATGERPRIAVVGLPGLVPALKGLGVDAIPIRPNELDAATVNANDTPLAIFAMRSPRDDADIKLIGNYIESGGTALFAGTGWGWQQTHPGQTLAADHLLNRLLAPMGLAIADGSIEKDGGAIQITPNIAPTLHAKTALELLVTSKDANAQLLRDQRDDLAQASHTVLQASRVLPGDIAFIKQLDTFAADAKNVRWPTVERPLRQNEGLSRVLVSYLTRKEELAPIDKLKANPAAASFPGQVPADAPRVNRTLDIDTKVPRWHSTGLYAAPGEIITVTIPAAAAKKGLRLRIGAHTDHTWHLPSWQRVGDISRAIELDQPVTRFGNPFGGLVYIEAPRNPIGEVKAVIANAVEAPIYVHGQTTREQWKTIRNRKAPWCEFASDRIILTFKSEAIRDLDDPVAVMNHWNAVMDACAKLAAIPTNRRSPERIVSDADISAGYMHSGYPIMTGLDVTTHFVDLAKLKSVESGWGFYHELGHNHQESAWTFEGTGEVTCNLFTMYVLETVGGVAPESASSRALAGRADKNKKYLAAPDFEKWKADPFLALAMYAQLRHAFGWEPFIKTFAEYQNLPRDQRPRSEADKRDQWMVRMSKQTGKNLGPFFMAWGVPTSEAARKSVEHLPVWKPAGM